MKKILVWLTALVMLFGCVSAASAEASSVQIQDKYYSSTGAVVDNASVSNNSRYDDVVISKTITGTDVENEFDITLTVKTKEEITTSTEAPDVAVVLVVDVSGSMSDGSLQAMQVAANSFLRTFAADANGGERKAAIVTYDGNVYLTKNWDDASVMSCPKLPTDGSGTNTHGGLLRAKVLLEQSAYDGVDTDDFEYRYVVLMSDGAPTRYLTDSSINRGDWTGSTSSSYNAETLYREKAQGVADDIKKMDGVELYAVGYDLSVNGEDERWLRDQIADKGLYFHADMEGLQSQFEAIANAIKISASAWIVTDPIADGVTLLTSFAPGGPISADGDTLEWNLRATTPAVSTAGNVTTYTYTATYRVRLDTLDSGFEEETWYRTNGSTSLTYWIEQDGQYLNNDHQVIQSPTLDNAVMTMYFNVPAVEGYKGDLRFIKVDDAGNPMSGVSFTAAVKGGSWSRTAVSGDDGVVSITGIPSGHTYVLTEATPEGYVENEAIEFAVSYGQVDYANFEMNEAGQPIVVNTRETGDAFITVTKEFKGVDEDDLPDSLTVTAVNQDNAELTYSATLQRNENYIADIIVLAPGTYAVSEAAPVIDGYNLESTAYTTPNADHTASIVTVAIDGTAAVTVTNTYNKQEAELTISKTFAGDKLTEEQMKGITFTVTGPDNYSSTIAYSQFQNGSYTLGGLALGTYTVTETANVDGYTVSTEYSAESITLADGDQGVISVTNTYNKQEGGLVIAKTFGGDAIPEEAKAKITFTVTGPDGFGEKKVTYSEFKDGMYNFGTVPLGEYTIVESNADVDGYIRTTSHIGAAQPLSRGITADYTARVTVSDDTGYTVDINNTYNKQEAELTISKTFAGDELTEDQMDGVTFTVTGPAGYSNTIAYSEFENGSYTLTGLELGEYAVTESADVDGYTVSTAYSAESITLADGDQGVISVTNTYNKQEGGLVLKKSFAGDAITDEQKNAITFTVTGPEGFETQTILYSQFENGQYSFGVVPLGEYTIVESNADVKGYERTTSHLSAVQPMTRAITAAAAKDTFQVTVNDDNNYTVAIVNQYNKLEADLTVSKTFAGELEAVTDEYKNAITFTVTGPDGFEQTVTYADFENGSYTFTGLALGEYTVTEGNAELAHYTVTASGIGSVTLADGDAAQMDVINTYAADPGNLKVTKSFGADSALTAKDFPNGIKVTATAVDGGQTYTATLSADNDWTYTFEGLVPGDYTVAEESTHDTNYYSFSAVFSGVAEGNVATVLPGTTRATEVTITNTYTLGQADELVIPFEKIVGLGEGGNTPPMGETTFYYTLDLGLAQSMQRSAVQPGTLEVSYKGGVEASDVPAYDFKVTVNGPNTAEGWIVIRGNAYDLQRLTVTITESEFGMTKRWTYESGPDYAWTVDAQQQADGSFKAVMTRADGTQGAKVSFLNKYTFVSEVPATGDRSQLLLWAVLMALSAAGFTLLLKRRERRDH